jgi:hypothetical protein
MAYIALRFRRTGDDNWMVYNRLVADESNGRIVSGRIVEVGLTPARATTLANVLNATLWAELWWKQHQPPQPDQ